MTTRIHWRTRIGFHGTGTLDDESWSWFRRESTTWADLMAAFSARGAIEAWCETEKETQ